MEKEAANNARKKAEEAKKRGKKRQTKEASVRLRISHFRPGRSRPWTPATARNKLPRRPSSLFFRAIFARQCVHAFLRARVVSQHVVELQKIPTF